MSRVRRLARAQICRQVRLVLGRGSRQISRNVGRVALRFLVVLRGHRGPVVRVLRGGSGSWLGFLSRGIRLCLHGSNRRSRLGAVSLRFRLGCFGLGGLRLHSLDRLNGLSRLGRLARLTLVLNRLNCLSELGLALGTLLRFLTLRHHVLLDDGRRLARGIALRRSDDVRRLPGGRTIVQRRRTIVGVACLRLR